MTSQPEHAAQVLLVDQTSGLVAGACAERMGGFGTIVLARTGSTPPQMFYWLCSGPSFA